MSDDAERKLLLEKAQRARRLAQSVDWRDPAAKKLLEVAADYEARARRMEGMPPPPAPSAPTHVAQQQQQPQPDDTDKKE
jgi:hypothetical protein